eukprot:scaffold4026_cov117-Cylindrotheca_fusiformis.AAC.6
MCMKQESRIHDLEAVNQRLREEAEAAKLLAGGKSDRMEKRDIMQLEDDLELMKSSLAAKEEELVASGEKEKELQSRLLHLQTEYENVKETEKNLRVEVEMSRTMNREMEQRMLDLESSTASTIRKASIIVQEKEKELEEKNSLVSNLSAERKKLLCHIDEIESGVEDLDSTNKELRSELDRARKELCESKEDVATLHDTLLHKLENGETRAQVETELMKMETAVMEVTKELETSQEQRQSLEFQSQAWRCTLLAGWLLLTSQSSDISSALQVEKKSKEDMTEKLEASQNMVNHLQADLNKKNAFIRLMEKQSSDMNCENAMLRESCSQVEADLIKMEVAVMEVTKELEKSQEQRQSLEFQSQTWRCTLLAGWLLFTSQSKDTACALQAEKKLNEDITEKLEWSQNMINSMQADLNKKKVMEKESLDFKSENAGLREKVQRKTDEIETQARQLTRSMMLLATTQRSATLYRVHVQLIHRALVKIEDEHSKVLSDFSSLKFSVQSRAEYQLALKEKISALESKNSKLQKEKSYLSSKLHRLNKERKCDEAFLQGSEETLSQAVEVIKGLETDIQSKDRELISAKARINELVDSEGALAAESECLREKLLCLEQKLTATTDKISALKSSSVALQSEKEQLEQKLDQVLDALREKEQRKLECASLQQSLAKAEHDLGMMRNRLDEAESTHMIVEADMSSLVDRLQVDLQQNEDALEKDRTQLFVVKGRNQELMSCIYESAVNSEVMKQEMLKLRTKLREVEEQNTLLQAELNETSEIRLCELQQAEKQRDANDKLRKEVIFAAIEIHDLQALIKNQAASYSESLSRICNEKEVQLQKRQHELESSQRQLLEAESRHEDLRVAVLVVESERDSIQSELAQSLEVAEKHSRKETSLVESLGNLKQTMQKAEAKICMLQAANKGARRIIIQKETEMALEIENRDDEIQHLLNDIKQLDSLVEKTVQSQTTKEKDQNHQIRNLQRLASALKGELVLQQLKCRDLERSEEVRKSEVARLEKMLAEMKANLLVLRKKSNKTESKHIRKVRKLANSYAVLEGIRDEKLRENSKLLETIATHKVEIDDLQQALLNQAVNSREKNGLMEVSQDLWNEILYLKREMESQTEARSMEIEDLKSTSLSLKLDNERLRSSLATVRNCLGESEDNRQELAEKKEELLECLEKTRAGRIFEQAAKVGQRRYSESLLSELAETRDNCRKLAEEKRELLECLKKKETERIFQEAAKVGQKRCSEALSNELDETRESLRSTLATLQDCLNASNDNCRKLAEEKRELLECLKKKETERIFEEAAKVGQMRCSEALSHELDETQESLRSTLATLQDCLNASNDNCRKQAEEKRELLECLKKKETERIFEETAKVGQKRCSEALSNELHETRESLRSTLATLQDCLNVSNDNCRKLTEEKRDLLECLEKMQAERIFEEAAKVGQKRCSEALSNELDETRESLRSTLATLQDCLNASNDNCRKLAGEKRELLESLEKKRAERIFEEAAKVGQRRHSEILSRELDETRDNCRELAEEKRELLKCLEKRWSERIFEEAAKLGQRRYPESLSCELDEIRDNCRELAEEKRELLECLEKTRARRTFEEAAKVGQKRFSELLLGELDGAKRSATLFQSQLQTTQSLLEQERQTCNEQLESLSVLEKENRELEDLGNSQQLENDRLSRDIIEARREINGYKEAMNSIEVLNKKNRLFFEAETTRLVATSSALEQAVTLKENKLTACKKELNALKSENASIDIDRERVICQLSNAREAVRVLERRNNRLNEEIESHKEKLQNLSDRNLRLSTTKLALEAAMEGLRIVASRFEEELTKMKAQYERKVKENMMLSDTIEIFRSQMWAAQEFCSKFELEFQRRETKNGTINAPLSERELDTDSLFQGRNETENKIGSKSAQIESYLAKNQLMTTKDNITLLKNVLEMKEKLSIIYQLFRDTTEETEERRVAFEVLETDRNSILEDLRIIQKKAKLFEREARQGVEEMALLQQSNENLHHRLRKALAQRCFEAAAREGLKLRILSLERCKYELVATLEKKNLEVCSLEDQGTQRAKVCGFIQNEMIQMPTRASSDQLAEGCSSSTPLQTLKSAFRSQKHVLANLSASEALFTDFMKEVSILGKGAQGEIAELLWIIEKCSRSLCPRGGIAALDLASLPSATSCIERVRSRLSRQGALASDAVEELALRQREFQRWQEIRMQPPKTPITPCFAANSNTESSAWHEGSLDLTTLFNEEMSTPFTTRSFRLEACSSLRRSSSTKFLRNFNSFAPIDCGTSDEKDDGIARKLVLSLDETIAEERRKGPAADNDGTKLAGIWLLSSILKHRNRMEKAAAFRKWTCASGAMKAASNQKQASAELSVQLETTRKKLIVLKTLLKKNRRDDTVGHHKKPRLRKLLSAVTEQRRPEF